MKATEQYFHDAVQGGSKLLSLWMKSLRVPLVLLIMHINLALVEVLSTNFTLASEISNK